MSQWVWVNKDTGVIFYEDISCLVLFAIAFSL